MKKDAMKVFNYYQDLYVGEKGNYLVPDKTSKIYDTYFLYYKHDGKRIKKIEITKHHYQLLNEFL